jgi:hypothetical protein
MVTGFIAAAAWLLFVNSGNPKSSETGKPLSENFNSIKLGVTNDVYFFPLFIILKKREEEF